MQLIDVVLLKVVEEIKKALEMGKKRGYIGLKGLSEEELGKIAQFLRGLGLRAGVSNNGVWWAVKAVKKTTQTPPPETK